MHSFRLGCAVAGLTLSIVTMGAVAPVWAGVSLPIVNAGFENPVLAEGAWQSAVPGWTQGMYDVSAPTVWIVSESGAGVWNPDTSGYSHASAFEGMNMAFTTSAPAYDTGLSQVLRDLTCMLQPDATYVLSAVVGNPYRYNLGPTANYRIELVAGGRVLASATGASPVDDTTWAFPTLTYNSGPAPEQIGQPLEIRLVAVNFAPGYKVDFDNVSIVATFAHPIAHPNGPYTVAGRSGTLALDGRASLPSDGSSLALYEWDLNNDGVFGDLLGPAPAPVKYTDLINIWGMKSGENIVRLRVMDATTSETAVAAAIVTLVPPPVLTYKGPNTSNADTWNVAANWDTGAVPSGDVDVVIPAGKLAHAWSNNTPTYTGNLTIRENATVQIGWTTPYLGSYNALGTPGSTTIYMYQGSHINMRMGGSPTIPAIVLEGDATITMGSSTQGPANATFAYGITGPYTLTLQCNAGGTTTLPTANSFSKLIVNALGGRGGNQWTLKATAPGALGTGDVIVQPMYTGNLSPQLYIGAPDVMADTATLYLYGLGPAGNGTNMLNLNYNDTIAELYFNGIQQEYGTYGKVGNTAVDYQVAWITGNGILTVAGVPGLYWDLNGTDPGAGGPTPTGTWDASAAYWNTDPTGGAAGTIGPWTGDKRAVFAAGTDATGTYTVTVDGVQPIIGLTFAQGNVTLSGGGLQMRANSAVRVSAGATATIDATISDDGTPRRLTKNGDGTLLLSGTNTYTGPTRLEAGTLVISALPGAGWPSNIGAYPTAGPGGLILVGGTLRYTGDTATTNRGFTLSGNSTIELANPGTALTLGNCETAMVSGTLTVTGQDGCSLALGELKIVEGAGITLNPTNVSVTVASVKGYTSYPGTSNLTLGGTSTGNVVTGNLFVQNPPGSAYTQPLHVFTSGTGEWTILGVFSGGGNLNVNGGTLTLSGTNTYTGSTTVTSGTLVVATNAPHNANGALGKATSDVTLGATGGNVDAILLIAGPYTVGRPVRIATSNNADTGTRVLTLGGATPDNSTFSGNIFLGTANNAARGVYLTAAAGGTVAFSGVIQNPTGMDANEAAAAAAMNAVTKVGPGTVVLSAANTYTGKTLIKAGTLLINGDQSAASGAVTVEPGATLGGTGKIGGAVTVQDGGTLAPGVLVGTLTLGNGLDMSAAGTGANMVWQLARLADSSDGVAGVDFDLLRLTGGDLVLGGQSTLKLDFGLLAAPLRPDYPEPDAFWTTARSWKIIDTTSNPDNTNFVNLVNANFSCGRFVTEVGAGPEDLGDIWLKFMPNLAPIAGQWIGTWGGVESWSTATNWQDGKIPTARGDTASFGESIGGSSVWVQVVENRTLSGLTFNNTVGGSYTLSRASIETLTLDNGTDVVPVLVQAGSHEIALPLILASPTEINVSGTGDLLRISELVSGQAGSLTKKGAGKLILSGTTSYGGRTTVSGGTLEYALTTSPTVVNDQQLVVTAGVVNVGGMADPFTDAKNKTIHMDVLNDGLLNITYGKKEIDRLTGSGTTYISGGAELTVSYLEQANVTVEGWPGIPGKLTIRASSSLPPGVGGQLGGANDASAAPVPEPSALALLGMTAVCLGGWLYRRRR